MSVRGNDIDEKKHGLFTDQVNILQLKHGLNEIVIKPTPVAEMLQQKILSPFYLFQVASVIIWCIQQYVTFAALIAIMVEYILDLHFKMVHQFLTEHILRSLGNILG